MNVGFPYGFDARGRTAAAANDRYVRDLIEQVLFVSPGDRVMRPDFGSNVAQLVFAPNSPEFAGATQMLIQSALHRWLADVVVVEAVTVLADDATVSISVQYRPIGESDSVLHVFTAPGVAP
jgi:uncharacterized protein